MNIEFTPQTIQAFVKANTELATKLKLKGHELAILMWLIAQDFAQEVGLDFDKLKSSLSPGDSQ